MKKRMPRSILAGLILVFLFFLALIIIVIPRFTFYTIMEQNCDYSGGDWVISDKNVVCQNRDISVSGNLIINGASNVTFQNVSLFIADSIFLNHTSTLVLNSTTLTMNISTIDVVNFTSTQNTNLTLINSTIRNNGSTEWTMDVLGSSYVLLSIFDNKTNYNINGSGSHQLESSIFYNKIYIHPGASNIKINNITVSYPSASCTSNFFETEANATINNSRFGCFVVNENAVVTLENSAVDNAILQMNSTMKARNVEIKNLELSGYAEANFETSNITDNLTLAAKGLVNRPKIYGNLTMPNSFDWLPGNILLVRYYPIYLKDQFNRPLSGWHVNITRGNALISEGLTDSSGRVELNITFNSSNYGPRNFSLNWNGTADINLANATPIVIIENIPNLPPYWSNNVTKPQSPAGSSNASFNFSIVWSDELNSTIASVLFENNFTGFLSNYSALSNCTAINLTSIQCNVSFKLSPGTYVFRWYAADLASNMNQTPVWSYEVFDDVPPKIQFVAPTPQNGTTLPYNYIEVNATVEDDSPNITILYLYNTSSLINTSQCYASNFCFNNFTDLPNGIYYINASANDSNGNINATETRTIVISVSTGGADGGSGGGGAGGNNYKKNNETNFTQHINIETCRPIWDCGPWSECIEGYQQRSCDVVNFDELYRCLKYGKILPPALDQLTKEQLLEKLKQGELAKYFGSYFQPPATTKSCGSEKPQEENKQSQQPAQQQQQQPSCTTPLLFFIILILFAISYLSYLTSLFNLKAEKEEEGEKRERKEKKLSEGERARQEEKQQRRNLILSLIMFFLLTFFLIWLLLTFKCPEWYFVDAIAILLYIVVLMLGVVKYAGYWGEQKRRRMEQEQEKQKVPKVKFK